MTLTSSITKNREQIFGAGFRGILNEKKPTMALIRAFLLLGLQVTAAQKCCTMGLSIDSTDLKLVGSLQEEHPPDLSCPLPYSWQSCSAQMCNKIVCAQVLIGVTIKSYTGVCGNGKTVASRIESYLNSQSMGLTQNTCSATSDFSAVESSLDLAIRYANSVIQ